MTIGINDALSKAARQERNTLMPRSKERNEKESTKERDKKESSAAAPYPPSTRVREDVILRGADVLKMPHDEARAWMRFMDENGWRFKDGTPVTRYTFMRSLRMWHRVEAELAEKRAAKRERELARQEREQERKERMARRKEREAKRAARQARNEADKTRALSRKEQAFEAQEREIAKRKHEQYLALKAQMGIA